MTAKELKKLLWSNGWSRTDYNGERMTSFDNESKCDSFLCRIWIRTGLQTVLVDRLEFSERHGQSRESRKRIPLRLISLSDGMDSLIADGMVIRL